MNYLANPVVKARHQKHVPVVDQFIMIVIYQTTLRTQTPSIKEHMNLQREDVSNKMDKL